MTSPKKNPVAVKAKVAEKVEPATGKVMVRVIKPVEGKNLGDEFECYPHEYKLQIKHKSLEVL